MRKTGSPKGDKAKADKLFSQLIRSRGACQNCGSTAFLQTAHIISRRYSAVRLDERNAVALCARCHHRFTDHPVEWGRFVLDYMGPTAYDALRLKAETPTKVDWGAEHLRLKQRLAVGESA